MAEPEITVGTLVRVVAAMARKSRVVEIDFRRTSVVYILADGGWFSRVEIEPIKDFRATEAKPIRWRCTICGDNYVDAESGYDACDECLRG